LPVLVSGDSAYRPLSRGLAELITTDLAYIRTLKLLERLQIGVLLDELKLGTSQRAAPATAARVGRLLRAERMVQGTVTIPSTGAGSVRLTASVVTGAGVIWPVAPATGPLQQLLGLERQAAQTAPALERAGADPVGSLSAVDALEHGTATVLSATGGVLSSGTLDVLPTPGDVVAQAGGTASGTATTIRHLGPETAGLPS